MDEDKLVKEREIEINAFLKQQNEMTKIMGELSALVDNGDTINNLDTTILEIDKTQNDEEWTPFDPKDDEDVKNRIVKRTCTLI